MAIINDRSNERLEPREAQTTSVVICTIAGLEVVIYNIFSVDLAIAAAAAAAVHSSPLYVPNGPDSPKRSA
jgi:hypothetical protein